MPKVGSAFYALQVCEAAASSTVRYLYLKLQTPTPDSAGAALFVAGLGVTYDESVVTELFSVFGEVSQVVLLQNKV